MRAFRPGDTVKCIIPYSEFNAGKTYKVYNGNWENYRSSFKPLNVKSGSPEARAYISLSGKDDGDGHIANHEAVYPKFIIVESKKSKCPKWL
jgi:hypothetical protein